MVFTDTIITDVTVHPMDSHHTRANAIAIKNGCTIAVDENHHALDYRGARTKRVNGRGIAWARLRRTPGKLDDFVYDPEQRLTPWEALAGYTTWAAPAQGDRDLGTVTPTRQLR
ncbi:hypothetical protein GCM10022198_06870 [Klugiella xanthotipulae]|uniref:hypothetical protein n=1 Tax=Klugiella xanthotipulae TaxID=244735 RepID=UPI001153AEBA|nr:hypothetical protein [Klugiella xanthotipulae]